ncbi:MAG: site-2 protease family protein [Firmicutes bacterium]|nr:site-2 protease family protein [Bacillota bacterium]
MLFRIPALLLAITVHEYAHGKMADHLGDPTARYAGRLTLNPLAHLDPLGLLMLWLFRFGWAKPVPINPFHFRNRRQGIILVSLAGPAANIIAAFFVLILFKLWPGTGLVVKQILSLCFVYNLYLAVFNLIPVPPLDGSKVLWGFLPESQAYAFSRLENYGPIILILLIYMGVVGRLILPMVGVLSYFLELVTDWLVFGVLYRFLLGF